MHNSSGSDRSLMFTFRTFILLSGLYVVIFFISADRTNITFLPSLFEKVSFAFFYCIKLLLKS